MSLNVAVDIGGTFTDLVGYDDRTGRLFNAKTPTTPRDLSQAIFECLQKSGVNVKTIANLVHGSTVAINTVVERKGAVTALVVTRGTRDVYKIGRGNRPEAYNIFFKRPEPLVPRHLTFEVDERLLADGGVLIPFNTRQARSVAKQIKDIQADAVAVCFLHSWANPANEIKMGNLLGEAAPGVYVSLSHDILREYGEYERTSTTVINSYIGPKISAYIDNLEKLLSIRNFTGSLLIMQSNGGVMSPGTAKKIPVAMLESGPVGGFVAAARIGSKLGFNNVIAFDMGGTTAKTNLIKDGEPQMSHGYYIGDYASGHPMMLPVIDTVEIGAGGGSIAWIDDTGALKVGPQSAGAEPGPICYGWGGTEPTITDANLLCGRLSPDEFLGGEMRLDIDSARKGIVDKVAGKIGLNDIESALAIIRISVVKMSLAVRGISVERGYDPRDFAMVAFGGAGPLHAVEVARDLHIPTVIVPNYPAHFSALGMLMTDVKHDYVRTYYKSLSQTDFKEVRAICDELIRLGTETLQHEAISKRDMIFERFLDIRYSGQEFSIPVAVTGDAIAEGDSASICEAFNSLHDRRYGYHQTDLPVDIVNVRLTARGKRKQLEFPPFAASAENDALIGKRPVFLENKEPTQCSVYRRERLAEGSAITGPAVIQEYASTTVLFPGDKAVVASTGELIIKLKTGK